MDRNFRTMLLLGAALVVGCGDEEGSGDGTPGSTGMQEGDETVGMATTIDPTATSTTGMGGSEGGSTGMADTGGTSLSFIQMPDGGGVAIECDVWAQDCPPGEKCMPWANDGGNSWNATKCSPVDPNPGQVGDECSVEGSGVSGVDSCDVASMCYYVDPDTNMGICVGFCMGSEAAPICNPGYICSIVNNGVLTLCRPECDPLLQDCQDNAACLPATGADGFTCIIDASGEAGAAGDPCEFINSCDPGLFCADAAGVPGCQGSQGCCSEFCDLSDPMPSSYCSMAGQGQTCVAWFEEGTAPPNLDHVGACVLP